MGEDQRYLIALGSNAPHHRHGAPAAVLRAALGMLEAEGVAVLAASPLIASAPVGPSKRRYANGAALVETSESDEPFTATTIDPPVDEKPWVPDGVGVTAPPRSPPLSSPGSGVVGGVTSGAVGVVTSGRVGVVASGMLGAVASGTLGVVAPPWGFSTTTPCSTSVSVPGSSAPLRVAATVDGLESPPPVAAVATA